MTAGKRRYESPKRREQADATRRRIAASARQLFARHGYAATTIESIAQDAGVAVQTFYATYGSKRAVLFALLDEIDAEAGVPELLEALREAHGDPRRQLAHVVDFNVRLFSGAADIMEILRAAGTADPDLASMSEAGNQRRRDGQAPLIEAWARVGALRSELSQSAAADILYALTSPEVYRLVVAESGWSLTHYREWLTATLDAQLFG